MTKKIWIFIFLFSANYGFSQNNFNLILDFCENCASFSKKYNSIYTFKDSTEVEVLINNVLQDLYSHSYLSAFAKKNKIDSVNYNLQFICNNKLVLTKLSRGNIDNDALKHAMFSKFESENVYDVEKLSRLIKKISEWYENNGYPFALIKLDSIKIYNDSIQASLYCKKNTEFKYNLIKNHGNLEINDKILEFIIGIQKDELYNEEKLKKLNRRIEKYNFIKISKDSEIAFIEDSCKLNVYLDKKASNTFDGMIGFMPDYQDENKLYWNGEINLSLHNSLSLAEKFKVSWKKPARISQDLNISANLPSILIAPFGASWDFYLHKADTSFIKIENSISIHYYKESTKISTYLKTENSSLLSTKKLQNLTKITDIADFKARLFGLRLEYNNYNNYFNPSKGVNLEIDLSAGFKEILKNPNLNEELYEDLNLRQLRANIKTNVNYYQPISKNTSLLLSNTSSYLFSENIFINEMYRVGGLHLMRGFDENFFFASAFSVQSIEYLFLFGESSRFSIFIDKAYIEQKRADYVEIFRPLAIGTGTTFETNAGFFSIYYALGKNHKENFSFSDSKIHFGFIAVF